MELVDQEDQEELADQEELVVLVEQAVMVDLAVAAAAGRRSAVRLDLVVAEET